jgi:3-(3-hydroxy-phenyl)propionate hydroxylase
MVKSLGHDDIVKNSSVGRQVRSPRRCRGAAVITTVPGSQLDRWLRHGRATAAIIRPDSTVMQTGRSAETLCRAVPPFHTVERTADQTAHRS